MVPYGWKVGNHVSLKQEEMVLFQAFFFRFTPLKSVTSNSGGSALSVTSNCADAQMQTTVIECHYEKQRTYGKRLACCFLL